MRKGYKPHPSLFTTGVGTESKRTRGCSVPLLWRNWRPEQHRATTTSPSERRQSQTPPTPAVSEDAEQVSLRGREWGTGQPLRGRWVASYKTQRRPSVGPGGPSPWYHPADLKVMPAQTSGPIFTLAFVVRHPELETTTKSFNR